MLQTIKEMLASIFYKVEGIVEVGSGAIVRVGHHIGFGMIDKMIGEHVHLAACLVVGSFFAHYTVVVVIHYKEHVEAVEVGDTQLACMAIEIVTAQGATAAHAGIGQLPHMPIADACRVDKEFVVASCIVHHATHHSLGCWRATDIAKTDEQ